MSLCIKRWLTPKFWTLIILKYPPSSEVKFYRKFLGKNGNLELFSSYSSLRSESKIDNTIFFSKICQFVYISAIRNDLNFRYHTFDTMNFTTVFYLLFSYILILKINKVCKISNQSSPYFFI